MGNPIGPIPQRPLERQEGGSHYKSFAIQPAEFCQRNKLTWCEANAVKYVCRHRDKHGAPATAGDRLQ